LLRSAFPVGIKILLQYDKGTPLLRKIECEAVTVFLVQDRYSGDYSWISQSEVQGDTIAPAGDFDI